MQVFPVIIKIIQKEDGSKIGKIPLCMWLTKNFTVENDIKFMAKGFILAKVKGQNEYEKIVKLSSRGISN